LARRQSQAAVLNQQRARQLAKLEELGRTLILLPADDESLAETLRRYVPRMFDYDQADIRLFNSQTLLRLPKEDVPYDPRLWRWFQSEAQPAAFVSGERLPWSRRPSTENLLLAPIRHAESNEPLGGVCLHSRGRITTLGFRESLPSLQVLAAQIASMLHRRESMEKRLALERVTQELTLARQMQVSFLPRSLPQIPGWELQAELAPARQTSGDFYDLIPLGDDALGLLIADVADKGMSAALFMALSRTLLRTYAYDYPKDPALVLAAANKRILSDTTDDSFVTVFYGVLDLPRGDLTYASAGHNPAYLLTAGTTRALTRTGMPLGIQHRARWETNRVQMAPDDLLLLYTDGVTDAHNSDDELFGVERLLHVVERRQNDPLPQLTSSIAREVDAFCGQRPQFDDLTLLLARRALVRDTDNVDDLMTHG
jgi:serine phosphatase RsbU (regulator of sigma subunit)